MSSAEKRGPVAWLSPPALRLHAVLLLGLSGCGAATWVEATRAFTGRHEIAWVYMFEWPLFGLMGTYLWWKLLHTEPRDHAERDHAEAAAPPRQLGPRQPENWESRERLEQPHDPELAAWQDYLARLHAVDPPGGPPPR